ncbi:OB-fold domain-containing protein [Actinoallomurus sp. NBC_01490]|uniref:OB-fold domain-containing protein n=1 Tax=Actinoallomurus sp. NBC_01490 TaxID=2903557 RepID=UPI002E35852A|nr:OB-fold domain-containing protein [Actinoallomurus sp. NBC_01490]
MHDRLMALADELAAEGESAAMPCPDPVNAAMIRNWTQALGDRSGRWSEYAPPAMIQVWSMAGTGDRPDQSDPGQSVPDRVLSLLDESGYTGVVATNCEHTYDRYLRLGEELSTTVLFDGVTGPKRTALGEGYFVTWYERWYSGGERVAEMLFRVLKFKPRGAPPAPAGGRYPLRPAVGPDTRFFWDGVRAGELRIQRCAECGALRHPPGPMCPACHATKRDHVVAAGRGVVHSYVVHHHPPVPGLTPPYVVALVELEEGVRIIGNLLGCAPGDAYVGMPVELEFQRMDEELTLPQWRPAAAAPTADKPPGVPEPGAAEPSAGESQRGLEPGEPELRIELTPTFVISTALATRDFTPVHHDPAVARAQGSADIFLNILTTIGLVQRYALERRPDARLAGIALRLGAPAYAGDTLTLTGRAGEDGTLEVRGAVGLGDHVVATVRLGEPA